MIHMTRACALMCALAWSATAMAQGVLEVGPDKERIDCPKERPTLVIKAPRPGKITLKVRPSAGGEERVFHARVEAGKELRQSWPQESGTVDYAVNLHVDYDDGKTFDGVMGFTFSCAAPIDVSLAGGGLDLARGILKLSVKGPAVEADLTVLDADGGVLHRKTMKIRGKKGKSTRLTLRWPVDEDRGFGGMDLKVYDRHGAWVELDLTPISLEIPHEEVEFENGKWDIRPTEEPKLQDTLARIREEMTRFVSELSEPALYIAGYTDTVGSKADNLRLSRNRARAIGRWFRKHGLKNPIYYQGFGEEVLAVDTPDETPEPANRRAVYILTNFPPPVQESMPRADWRRLR